MLSGLKLILWRLMSAEFSQEGERTDGQFEERDLKIRQIQSCICVLGREKGFLMDYPGSVFY